MESFLTQGKSKKDSNDQRLALSEPKICPIYLSSYTASHPRGHFRQMRVEQKKTEINVKIGLKHSVRWIKDYTPNDFYNAYTFVFVFS